MTKKDIHIVDHIALQVSDEFVQYFQAQLLLLLKRRGLLTETQFQKGMRLFEGSLK